MTIKTEIELPKVTAEEKPEDDLFYIKAIDDKSFSLPKTLDACATCHTCGGPCSCHSEYANDEGDVLEIEEDKENTPKQGG